MNHITTADPNQPEPDGPGVGEGPRCAADSEAQKAAVDQVVAERRPKCASELDPQILAQIEPLVRFSVQAANPETVLTAQEMLREVFKYAIWALRKFGFVNSETIWHPENVHLYVDQHCAHFPKTTRKQARWVLSVVGRAANKQHWPREPEKLSKNVVADPYSANEEAALAHAALLKGELGRPEELAVASLSLGAGLNAGAIAAAVTDDIVDLGNGRVAIQVKGPHARLVPIRADYTEMALRAVEFAQTEQFVPSQGKNAVYIAAKRVMVHGFGNLEFRRARSTWLKAHLDAGTPLAALRVIAGPLSMNTLDVLVGADSKALPAEAAASEGLRA